MSKVIISANYAKIGINDSGDPIWTRSFRGWKQKANGYKPTNSLGVLFGPNNEYFYHYQMSVNKLVLLLS